MKGELVGAVFFLLAVGQLDPDCSLSQDNDGDGYSELYGDCDDRQASIHPNAPEICNSIDDNCDSMFDECCQADPIAFCTQSGGVWETCTDGCGQRSCLSPEGESGCEPSEVCIEQCICPESAPIWDTARGCIAAESCGGESCNALRELDFDDCIGEVKMEERYAPTGESMTTLLNFEQSCDLLALYLLRYSGGTYDSEYTSALYAILTADEQGKTVAAIWFEDDWDAWGDAPHEDVETFDLIALKDAYRAQGGTESTLTVRLGLSEGAPSFEYYLGDE